MTDKSQTTNVGYGQLSEKARGTLHEKSRPQSLNLAATKLHAPKKVVPDPAKGWSATGVKDEQTDLVSFDICGPTRGGDTFQVSIPAEQREELKRVRKTLRSYDAALPGQVDDDLEFLEKLFDGANVSPLIATSKPGFTDTGKGFVLGVQMFGDAANRYLWIGDDDSTLGQTCGTREGWNEEVGKLLQYSSFATIAVLTVLASPIRAYVLLRKSEDPRWRPAVSETSIFNFAGDSGSGKTLATGSAASLSGDPSDRAKWDFSRRGLEEYLHTRNEVGAIFDDVEKFTGESMTLRRAITTLTQSLPDGASKVVSRVARDIGLPRLTWSSFGLSSSPRSIQEIARDEGCMRSLGEQVRLIDECIPSSSRGGIFDAPPSGSPSRELSHITGARRAIGARPERSMSDQYYSAIQEQWSNIRGLYMAYGSKKPIMLYDIHEKKIYAYPYKEFKAELSEKSQVSLEIDYKSTSVRGGMKALII